MRQAVVCKKGTIPGTLAPLGPPESPDAAMIRKWDSEATDPKSTAEVFMLIPLVEYRRSSLAGSRPILKVR